MYLLCLSLLYAAFFCPTWRINVFNNNNNNNNNNRISTAQHGCHFRGAGGRSDQCSVDTQGWGKYGGFD